MRRCLQLARQGEGFTQANPMVGAVIVHNNQIIGEGFHRRYGEAHAEVNAIHSVKEPWLLPASTMYVSLEPCAHFGKTPPCAELIVSRRIPRVVVATADPNPQVSGKGIEILRQNGVDVSVGMLQNEARELNKTFFVNQLLHRPFVMLKWAQSSDGFMDRHRASRHEGRPAMLSNALTQSIVHKFRAQVQAIMVGTNTARLDNPQLTARKWFGAHPVRVVIDRENKLPADCALFDDAAPTLVFTQSVPSAATKHAEYIAIDFSGNVNEQILSELYRRKIGSLMVEGGAKLLASFINAKLWDEAYIEIAAKTLSSGVKSPEIQGAETTAKKYLDSVQIHLKSEITRNFL